MKKQILILAAAALAAFTNQAFANPVEKIECYLYPIERNAPSEKDTTVEQQATECVARFANVNPNQVKVLAVDFDADQVLLSIVFSSSTKTVLVTDKETRL